jgi:hypothetical protein
MVRAEGPSRARSRHRHRPGLTLTSGSCLRFGDHLRRERATILVIARRCGDLPSDTPYSPVIGVQRFDAKLLIRSTFSFRGDSQKPRLRAGTPAGRFHQTSQPTGSSFVAS